MCREQQSKRWCRNMVNSCCSALVKLKVVYMVFESILYTEISFCFLPLLVCYRSVVLILTLSLHLPP